VKYAGDLLVLAKKGEVLQGMIDRLNEIGRWNGIEVIVGETKVMRISKQPFQTKIMVDQKHSENVEYFICLGRCRREIRSRFAMEKAAFNKK
jgi:hypothetical protein